MPPISMLTIVPLILWLQANVALDNTFLGIPGLKQSQSPQSAEEENDDTFSFLRADVNGHSSSAQPEGWSLLPPLVSCIS
jgi:hypothetical protein